MRSAILASWALFLGIALMMLGNGLQGSLLGMRAALEGFSTGTTGIVMSGYFLGFLIGSTWIPKIVERVGHIRVFAVVASLASASVLLYAVFPDPLIWGGMRVITGFAYAGMYIVAESWLNARATNETRGQLLSVYMIVMLGGMACGQFLLNVAEPGGYELFVLISVLVSLALVPISLSNNPAPHFSAPAPLSLKQLFTFSPLGFLSAIAIGMTQGAVFTMGAVYAVEAGFSRAQVSLFMSAVIIGGIVLQWPIGWLSDKFDRRRVLTGVTFLAALTALSLMPMTEAGTPFYLLAGLFGGLCLPMYSLCVAYINDHLEPEQMVAASSSIVFIGGVGAILGPSTIASMMSVVGAGGFFGYLAIVHALIGVYALYRMTRRRAKPLEEQGHYVPMSSRISQVAMVLAQEAASQRVEDSAKESNTTTESDATSNQRPGTI